MGNIIETKDVFGEEVICSHGAWMGHVLPNHPVMKDNLSAVKDTIESPEAVFESSQNKDRKVYFKESKSSTYNMYTKVVTKSIGENVSEIVSAWPQKEIKGGIGDEIYHEEV